MFAFPRPRTCRRAMLLAAILLWVARAGGAALASDTEDEDTEAAAADAAAAGCRRVAAEISAAYKGVFYENDFGYLARTEDCPDDPRDPVTRAADSLKQIPLSEKLSLSLGGESRLRYHHEDGIGSSRLDGLDNDFLLSRVRTYADLRITDYVRGFVEVIDARQTGTDLPPRGIEVVRGDVLNGFVEAQTSFGEGRLFARVGRQEMLLGAQRLISPLDWGNTRRSFDGFRSGFEGTDLQVSAWFVNPREIRDTKSRRNEATDFSGLYATWTGLPGQTFDLYALNLDRDPVIGPDSNVWTLGTRGKGRAGPLLWEIEGAVQRGDNGGLDVKAFMVTAGIGADLEAALDLPSTLWFYYDRASGDGDPADGKHRTFDQLFPLAHAYFGAMDLVGRRNIEALSLKWSTRLHPMVRLTATGHDFALAKARDALYNAGGAAIRQDPTGRAGDDVGRELDLALSISPVRWATLQLGYSRFFAGDFIEATNGPGVGGDADFVFSALTVRY